MEIYSGLDAILMSPVCRQKEAEMLKSELSTARRAEMDAKHQLLAVTSGHSSRALPGEIEVR